MRRGCVTRLTAVIASVPSVETIIVSAMLMRLISAISSTEGRAMALMRRYASRFEGSSPRRMDAGTMFSTLKKLRMPVIGMHSPPLSLSFIARAGARGPLPAPR